MIEIIFFNCSFISINAYKKRKEIILPIDFPEHKIIQSVLAKKNLRDIYTLNTTQYEIIDFIFSD